MASLSDVEVGDAEGLRFRPPGTTAAAAEDGEEEEQRTMKDGRNLPKRKWVLLDLEEAARWSSCFSLIGCSATSISADFCSLLLCSSFVI